MENSSNQKISFINITEKGIEINNKQFPFPLNFSDLKYQLGDQYKLWKETDTNFIYMWHDLGIRIFAPKNDEDVLTLGIKTANIDAVFLPKNKFSGELKINNQDYIDFFSITETDQGFKDIKLKTISVLALLSEDRLKTIEEISI